MKITISDTCFGRYIEFNGKTVGTEYEPLRATEQEVDNLINFLCEEFKRQYKDGTVDLVSLIECFQYDDYRDLGTCDQCEHYSNEITYIF